VEEEGQKEGDRKCSIHCKNNVSLMFSVFSKVYHYSTRNES